MEVQIRTFPLLLAKSPHVWYGWYINDDVTGRPDTVLPPCAAGLERPMRHDQQPIDEFKVKN